jgi:hypothetical protein
MTTPYNTSGLPVGAAPSGGGPFQLLAATPVAGYTLVNGTGNIISYTFPNDGKLHRVAVAATLSVSSSMTGGNVYLNGTAPDGTAIFEQMVTGGQAGPEAYWINFPYTVVVEAGSTIAVAQQFALTAGAAKLWAELYGS